ncbi:hypothetical protein ACC728_39325, partial [Rhizobium ruizarguesonis]
EQDRSDEINFEQELYPTTYVRRMLTSLDEDGVPYSGEPQGDGPHREATDNDVLIIRQNLEELDLQSRLKKRSNLIPGG